MKKFWNKRNIFIALLTMVIAGIALGPTTSTIISRLLLDHPDLGHDGGAGLHTKIETLLTKVGDNMSSRYEEVTIGAAATETIEHNFDVPFDDLHVVIWDGQGTAKVLVTDLTSPSLADYTVVANGGDAKGSIDITNTTGGSEDLSIEIHTGNRAFLNSDWDGGTASDTQRLTFPQASKATLDALTRKEGNCWWASDLDKVFCDDGTTLQEQGGGGAGLVNYITNPDFEVNDDGWDTYDDGSVAEPVDCDGGFAFTNLEGQQLGLWNRGAGDRRGEGIRFPFTIDGDQKNKTLDVSFSYGNTSFTDDDIQVFIYDIENAKLIPVGNPSTVVATENNGRVQTTFISSDSFTYRLCLHITTVNAVNWGFEVDRFRVGPQEFVETTPQTDWVAVNDPTSLLGTGWGTVTLISAFQKRVGDRLFFWATWKNGTVIANSANMSLPDGLIADSTKLSTETNVSRVGSWSAAVTSGSPANVGPEEVFIDGSDFATVYFSQSSANNELTKGNVNDFLNTNDTMIIEYSVPIASFAGSSVSIANSADNTTDFSNSVNGCQGFFGVTSLTAERSKRVRFLSNILSTDRISVEIMRDGSDFWVDAASGSSGTGLTIESYDANDNNGCCKVEPVSGSSTDLDIAFRQFKNASNLWSAVETTARWRVVKASNPISVGNALNVATSQTDGCPGGENICDGEYTPAFSNLNNLDATPTLGASGVWHWSLLGKTLTVYGEVNFDVNSVPGNGAVDVTLPGLVDVDFTDADNCGGSGTADDGASDVGGMLIKAVASSTTVKLDWTRAQAAAIRTLYFSFHCKVQ